MLDPKQREALENHARAILVRYVERSERLIDAQGRSTLPSLIRQLRDKTPRPPIDFARANTISDLAAWCLSVACAMNFVGPEASRVILWRLTRREKSSEGSWRRIANDLEEAGFDSTVADCKQMYEMGLPIMVEVFEQQHITTSYRESAAA